MSKVCQAVIIKSFKSTFDILRLNLRYIWVYIDDDDDDDRMRTSSLIDYNIELCN